MVLEPIPAYLGATGLGGLVGALSAYLGWGDTAGQPFDVKKFIKGLVTGAIAGVVTVALAFDAIEQSLIDPTGVAFLKLMIVIGLSILGADVGTSKVAGLMTSRVSAFKSSTTTPS